jgi:DNA polymerase III sliding clamp (beta) subunit (PCNA family)
MQEDKIQTVEGESLNSMELEGGLLLTLLEGVSTHAGKDKSLPTLNAVEVEGKGGLFIARATDRYRLIEGQVAAEGGLDKALISLDDTKRIIALLKATLIKAHKGRIISLIRLGDALTVSALGDTVTVTLLAGIFPPTEDLFVKGEGEPVPIASVAFNPAFFTDYAKIAGKGAAVKVYFTGEGKPMRVWITSDTINWRALLMPMRYTD